MLSLNPDPGDGFKSNLSYPFSGVFGGLFECIYNA